MKILTAAEMAETDRQSVAMGVPVATLMENAGAAVAKFCLRHYADVGLVVVLCGNGNNGGDGKVAARLLSEAGRNVRVVLLDETADEAGLRMALDGAALVIDAVVGTGFKPPLRGLAATARDVLAELDVAVVAIDLPSGWNADSLEQKSEDAFRADSVVTFVAPKLAHVFGQLTPSNVFGAVVVAPIGTPAEAVAGKGELHWTGAAKRIAEAPRDANGNKGKFGHVLLIGGALGKAGAPSMASLACMRAGAGLTTAAVPREILPTVAAIAPELMLTPLEAGEHGLELAQLEPDKLEKLLKGITVVAAGPGLGTDGTTPEFVRTLLERVTLPLVLDADALNALAGKTRLLKQATEKAKARGEKRTLVLTPHPGEMARLVGKTVKEVEADRIGLAREFATANGVTLVLKGRRTLIAHPDGRTAVNTTGNPSMAKGGSGDILTGIVAAMLAQYARSAEANDIAKAVEAAIFLHGLAGDFAALAQDEHTVLATDTVAHLWQAFRARVTDADGFTWIAGTARAVLPR